MNSNVKYHDSHWYMSLPKRVEFPLMKRIRKFGVLQTSDERMLELALCFLLGFPIDNVTSLLDYKSSYDHWPPS